MPRFAANLTFLFTELPFLDRFEAAARAGFRGVEFHYPFAVDPVEIRKRLVEQVTGTVRWRESVAAMSASGVTQVYEIGAGKVLCGLAKRIVTTLEAKPVGTPEDIEAALAALKS